MTSVGKNSDDSDGTLLLFRKYAIPQDAPSNRATWTGLFHGSSSIRTEMIAHSCFDTDGWSILNDGACLSPDEGKHHAQIKTTPGGDTGKSPPDSPSQTRASQGDELLDGAIQPTRPGIDRDHCSASSIPAILFQSFSTLPIHHHVR